MEWPESKTCRVKALLSKRLCLTSAICSLCLVLFWFPVRKRYPRHLNIDPADSTEGSGVRRKFSWGCLVQGHMVVICIWSSLFVTSQSDVISMFPNQRFGEVS